MNKYDAKERKCNASENLIMRERWQRNPPESCIRERIEAHCIAYHRYDDRRTAGRKDTVGMHPKFQTRRFECLSAKLDQLQNEGLLTQIVIGLDDDTR